jgi:hypothetical protein
LFLLLVRADKTQRKKIDLHLQKTSKSPIIPLMIICQVRETNDFKSWKKEELGGPKAAKQSSNL